MTVWRIVVRNLLRNPLRAALGSATVFLAVTLLHLHVGAQAGFEQLLEGPTLQGTAIVQAAHKPALAGQGSIPCSWLDELRAMSGVIAAGCHFSNQTIIDGKSLYVLGVEPEQWRLVLGADFDIPRDVWQRFVGDPNAALIARGDRLRFDVQLGQHVVYHLTPPGEASLFPDRPRPPDPQVALTIVGEIAKGAYSHQAVLVHHDTLSKAQNWPRGFAMVRFSQDADRAALARQIETHFADRVEVVVLESLIWSTRRFIGQLLDLVLFVVSLIAVLIVAILIHGVAIAGYELLPEVGALRALGLSRLEVLGVLGGEGVFACLSGALLSTALLWLLTSSTTLVDLSEISPMVAPVFELQPKAVWLVAVASLGVAGVGAVIPSFLLSRQPIARLLRARR